MSLLRLAALEMTGQILPKKKLKKIPGHTDLGYVLRNELNINKTRRTGLIGTPGNSPTASMPAAARPHCISWAEI